MKMKICQLCGREITGGHRVRHHLKPRKFNKGLLNNIIHLHVKCHAFIHIAFSEEQLNTELNTLEKILDEPITKMYLNWIEQMRLKTLNTSFKKKVFYREAISSVSINI